MLQSLNEIKWNWIAVFSYENLKKKKNLQKTTKETEDNVQEHSQSDDPLMTMLLKNQTII